LQKVCGGRQLGGDSPWHPFQGGNESKSALKSVFTYSRFLPFSHFPLLGPIAESWGGTQSKSRG